jgi:hypothetical protein
MMGKENTSWYHIQAGKSILKYTKESEQDTH